MIAYILKFTSSSAAHSVLRPLDMSIVKDGNNHLKAPHQSNWFPISAIVTHAVANAVGTITTPQITKNGYWLLLHTNQPIAAIENLSELLYSCDTADGTHTAHCEEVCDMNTELMDILTYDGLPMGVMPSCICCQMEM